MSKYQALKDALKAGPVKYACHVDGEVNDSCAFDAGQNLFDCTIANLMHAHGFCKTDCKGWRPINIVKSTIEVKVDTISALLADLEAAEKALKDVQAALYMDDAGQYRMTRSFDETAIDAALSQLKGVQ